MGWDGDIVSKKVYRAASNEEDIGAHFLDTILRDCSMRHGEIREIQREVKRNPVSSIRLSSSRRKEIKRQMQARSPSLGTCYFCDQPFPTLDEEQELDLETRKDQQPVIHHNHFTGVGICTPRMQP